MAGRIIYSYPVFRAIQEGYVKRLKAIQLNPRTLRFMQHENGQDIEIPLAEVIRRGEEESRFRRGILTSKKTLDAIVDASLGELDKLRERAGESKLKIIASALNYGHCHQIVAAYGERGRRADFIHSQEDSKANERVLAQLERHELDVIVQVRKLGEGFDHPYLTVAAVFSVFNNLSPFVQFVGRIMRIIDPVNTTSPVNQGVVIYHAGANVARRWEDFQQYSEADQDFFDQLLPVEIFDPAANAREIIPIGGTAASVIVSEQNVVDLQEIPLLTREAQNAIELFIREGIIPGDFNPETETLQRLPVARQRQRQTMRQLLDNNSMNIDRIVLGRRGIDPNRGELDTKHLGRTNLICMKAAIDRQINKFAGKTSRSRYEFSRDELARIEAA